VDRAGWHTFLGDHDAAFRDLEQAADERAIWLPFVAKCPDLKPLRSDPRYDALMRRIRLR